MQLYPGQIDAYRRRHDAIWPELAGALRAAGIIDYRIFCDETTGTLFAVMTLADDHRADGLPQAAVMQRWWAHMADIMETEADDAPVEVPLTPVFSLIEEGDDARD
nr:L-rhamnose mutarotase [Salinisphaera sp. Q1T1-3]